jgi:hypothetical protein
MNKFKKIIMIFGLQYSVLWSIIIFFIWDTGSVIFTELDLIAGVVIIHISYRIYKNKPVTKSFLYTALILASLIYNSLWTLVIMIFLEIDLAGLGLPLDMLSLYATCGLAYSVWHSERKRYLLGA